jgi:hypothetical protein
MTRSWRSSVQAPFSGRWVVSPRGKGSVANWPLGCESHDMTIMTTGTRKLTLTAHITACVGWLGAVGAFLVLAVSGLMSPDAGRVRAAYLAMESTGWFIIVPLSLVSPLTGVVQSLGTTWGLFRHYWVLIKFLVTIPATILLLVHMQPVGHLARVVEETTLARGELAGLRIQLVADAGAALVVLFIATTLSVYKPRGMTPYGRRKHDEERGVRSDRRLRVSITWGRSVIFSLLALALLFLAVHLAGGGLHSH